jgi:MFS transporter, CP family, cyanate transporter
VVILAGVAAALHLAKLFPALPELREALGISLLQAGFLMSTVQLAGMSLGLAVGLLAESIGLKRCMLIGLLVLSGASAFASASYGAISLIVFRAIEGFGFLLVCTPAPSLIRKLVPSDRLGRMLGVWGTYMPLATALALLVGPWVLHLSNWRVWWLVLTALSLTLAWQIWQRVPNDAAPSAITANNPGVKVNKLSWSQRLGTTLSSSGPWLLALCFATYSGQWVAVIGFLPTIYDQAGFTGAATAALTALAAAVNMVGNAASGRLLEAGVPAHRLLYMGFCTMAVMAWLGFGAFGLDGYVNLPVALRFCAVLLFSMVGGLIPGVLFTLAVRVAPSPVAVAATVGWMQQWSSFGQFVGPPAVAWVASSYGGWQWTWVVTSSCAAVGLMLAWRLGQRGAQ